MDQQASGKATGVTDAADETVSMSENSRGEAKNAKDAEPLKSAYSLSDQSESDPDLIRGVSNLTRFG